MRDEIYREPLPDIITAKKWVKRTINQYRSGADLDSFRYYAHTSLAISRVFNYDTGRIQVYHFLALNYLDHYVLDSSQYYLDLAIPLVINLGGWRRLAIDYLWYGWTYTAEAKFDSAIHMFSLSYEQAAEIKDTFLMQAASIQIAVSYQNKGDYIRALQEYRQLEQLVLLSHYSCGLVNCYCAQGYLYYLMGLENEAWSMVKTTLKLMADSTSLCAHEDDELYSNALYQTYLLASKSYLRQNQYDSAIYFAKKALPFTTADKDIPLPLKYLEAAYIKANQPDSAEKCFHQIVEKLSSKDYARGSISNSQYTGGSVYLVLGDYEMKFGSHTRALEYYRRAEVDPLSTSIWEKKEIFQALYHYYDNLPDVNHAYTYYKKYKTLEDSILNSPKAFNIGIASMEFKSKQIEAQVALLSKDNALHAALASRQKQQKNMVLSISSLLLMMSGIGFYRFKKNKEIKNKQELLNERLRISRDLHDEVGATLSGIAMYSHLAKEQSKENTHQKLNETLSVIGESSGEMVRKMGEIVWLLNPEFDSLKKLMEHLDDFSKRAALSKRMRIRTDLSPDIDQVRLSFEARRNIYLICKEAINNALKYSRAQELEIEVTRQIDALHFNISDNGIGFDMGEVSWGHGIKNMMYRADQIGAKLKLTSAPMKGTQLMLNYNLIQ